MFVGSVVETPAMRADQLCRSIDSAADIGAETLKKAEELPTNLYKSDVEQAKAQHHNLFTTKTNAHHLRLELTNAGFVQRYLKRDFICEKDGEQLVLSELESDSYTFEVDALATSTRVKDLSDLEKERAQVLAERVRLAEEGLHPPPVPELPNPFAEPSRSFDLGADRHGLVEY